MNTILNLTQNMLISRVRCVMPIQQESLNNYKQSKMQVHHFEEVVSRNDSVSTDKQGVIKVNVLLDYL